ncbi:hypothetical protein ABMA27_013201 [Loxostege sticticalis]|uniref:CRAL-TRIO domain-containing protein n=1 Tax=Loxostege sticticalis TaxID=481309 RepID=A0ABR3IEF3_LOXSC
MSVRELSPELAAKAQAELNEDPKRIKEDLQHLKDWLAKQPHLNARRDDQWLIAFLRGCKFSLERTKEKLDLYYAIRKTAPDLYRIHHKDPLFNEILELGSYIVLPKAPGPTSPKISIVSPGRYDADKYSISDILSVSNVLLKIILFEDDHSVVAGMQTILDLEGVTMSHFFQMTPLQMKKMVVSGQDALPLRMKGTHYLNTPAGFETVFNAIKGLLNEKNKNRLYVHNKNYDEMYKYIPKEYLPKEYGGEAGSIKEITDYWKKKVDEYSDWLEEDLRYGTDESKRPGKPKTAEDILIYLNMIVRELCPELAEKARLELNEDETKMNTGIEYLKTWIAKQPHIHARTDDQWLAAFLRGCKFSLERAKEKLDFHYTVRNTAKDLFRITHKDTLFYEILDLGAVLILPKLPGPAEPRVAIVRPGRYNPNKYTVSDIISASNILQKIIIMEDDNCIVAGIRAVLDLEGVTLGHFMQMTPIQMKKLVVSLQDVNPFRMKGTHYINVPPGFEMFLNAIKALLNEKSRSRLFVHNKNYEDMYKYIPKDVLPAEYGGEGGTTKEIIKYWKERVQEYGAWLEEDLQYRTDESKRPGKPKTAEAMFGSDGSFRQLQVD